MRKPDVRIAEFGQQPGGTFQAALEWRAAPQTGVAFEVGVAVEPGERVGVGVGH